MSATIHTVGDLLDPCRKVVETATYRPGPPFIIDLFTASAVVQVFDALKAENQTRALAMPFVKFADFAMSRVAS